MSDFFSIPPVGFSGLAGIPPTAFQLLTTETTVSASSIFDSGSSIIKLSEMGQLLSAVTSFRSRLDALQNTAADAGSTTVLGEAQGFVDAFNNLQNRIGSVQALLEVLPGTALVDRVSQAVDELASAFAAGDNSSLASLQRIGIELQAAPSSAGGTTGLVLRVDLDVLANALEADAAATTALLAQTAASFEDQLAGFEAQVAGASVSLVNLLQSPATVAQQIDPAAILGFANNPVSPGPTVSTGLLQGLSADTLLNNLQLSDLDLAASGLDAATLLSDNELRRGALDAELLPGASASANVITSTAATPTTTESITAAVTLPVAAPVAASAPTAASAATTAETAAAPTVVAAAPATISTTEANAGTGGAVSAATLALQNLLLDPAVHAKNIVRDPFFAALIAASRLNEFVPPGTAINPIIVPAELPEPISPSAPSRAVASYSEAVGGKPPSRLIAVA